MDYTDIFQFNPSPTALLQRTTFPSNPGNVCFSFSWSSSGGVILVVPKLHRMMTGPWSSGRRLCQGEKRRVLSCCDDAVYKCSSVQESSDPRLIQTRLKIYRSYMPLIALKTHQASEPENFVLSNQHSHRNEEVLSKSTIGHCLQELHLLRSVSPPEISSSAIDLPLFSGFSEYCHYRLGINGECVTMSSPYSTALFHALETAASFKCLFK